MLALLTVNAFLWRLFGTAEPSDSFISVGALWPAVYKRSHLFGAAGLDHDIIHCVLLLFIFLGVRSWQGCPATRVSEGLR